MAILIGRNDWVLTTDASGAAVTKAQPTNFADPKALSNWIHRQSGRDPGFLSRR
jgi:hypothetical protein